MSVSLQKGLLASSWHKTLPSLDWPTLSEAQDTDVLIVGGGIAGVSLALNLALLGHQPVLLEAERIGAGATGASGGIVAPQLARHDPRTVAARLGAEHAERLIRMVAASGHYLFDLARDHAADLAEAEQSGFLAPATGHAGHRRLAALIESWAPFRRDLSLLTAQEIAQMSGVQGYAGAMHDSSGGMLNPAGLALGLARAADAQGARIFANSAVTSLHRSGNRWIAQGAHGRVAARRVILCANGANGTLHPRLRGTVLPMSVCEVTTAPLSDALRARVLPGRQALTDMQNDVFTIRYDRDGGLVTAYPLGKLPDRDRLTGMVNARLAAAIPGWEPLPLPLAQVWHGQAQINASLLPRLVALDEDLIAVQACNGRGLAINATMGRDLARWLDAPARVQPPLPLESPRRINGYLIARHIPHLVMTAGLLTKKFKQILGLTGQREAA